MSDLALDMTPNRTLRYRLHRTRIDALLVSCLVCAGLLCLFVLGSDRLFHWFIIPVLACGIVIGLDAVRWAAGRLDLFDPIGIMGVLGLHFFFLAPLLHVFWDDWMPYIIPPDDWRPWLGYMALLNLAGLFVYRRTRGLFRPVSASGIQRTRWRINRRRVTVFLGAALILTAALQAVVYARYGGISGYIEIYETRYEEGNTAFAGAGWLFMISESFPILAFFAFALAASNRALWRSWPVLVGVLVLFLVAKILFGGLRGSRSNTIWGLFWAVGIIHLWIRPLSRRTILAGLVFLVAFMVTYGYYKAAGIDGLRAFFAGENMRGQESPGEELRATIVGDLARSDTQAFLLYRLSQPDSSYQYAWGRTYYAATTIYIPSSVWPNRPYNKSFEGTELQFGPGTYNPKNKVSSRVYGLAGEAMLNFGPLAIPFVFVFLGLAVSLVRYWMIIWDRADVRRLFLPFLVNLCFIVLIGDADNVMFYIVKNGALPFAVLWSCAHIQLYSPVIPSDEQPAHRGAVTS